MNKNQQRAEANKAELVERLGRTCVKEGANEVANKPVQALQFYRYSGRTQPNHGVYVPSICVVAQGAKEVNFGDERLRYDSSNYLLISLDVPVVSQVVEATLEISCIKT